MCIFAGTVCVCVCVCVCCSGNDGRVETLETITTRALSGRSVLIRPNNTYSGVCFYSLAIIFALCFWSLCGVNKKSTPTPKCNPNDKQPASFLVTKCQPGSPSGLRSSKYTTKHIIKQLWVHVH